MIDIPNITRKRDLLPPNDAKLGTHSRHQQTITGKTVEIGAGGACDHFYGATFVDCDVRLCGSGMRTNGAVHTANFQDCQIWAKKKQNIPNWEAAFERCYFRGTFGVRFAGKVVDCDFSKARLIYAQFLQTGSLGAVVWPVWPHVVIDDLDLNRPDWLRIPKPAQFNDFLVADSGVASVLDLADAVEDPEAFWQRIQHCPYVHSQR